LLQPIVLDSECRILDGRNRHTACEIAKVEPRFETYEGDDPDGYALGVNITRRDLTKGQIALIAARARKETAYPELADRVAEADLTLAGAVVQRVAISAPTSLS
jgi:hypothetical protein